MNSAYPTTTEASNTAAINQAASDNAVAAAVSTRQPTIGPQEFTVEPITQAQRDPLPPLPQGSLHVDAVPAAQKPQAVPMLRILLPVVMIAVLVLLVGVMFFGGGSVSGVGMSPMLLIFPLMMVMSMAMMFMPQGQQADADDTRRTYLRHLDVIRDKAENNADKQRAHQLARHPHPEDLHARLSTRRLWERAGDDDDVLQVRLGLGEAELCTPVEVSESGAPEDLDPVCAVSVRRTVDQVSQVAELPIVVQLQAFSCIGVSGIRARALARALLAQLVVHHGPETVGISVVDKSTTQNWEWLKWLPHTRRPDDAQYRILLVDDVPTTGTEDFLVDDEWTTIIDINSRSTTALGIRAEMEGLLLFADDELAVQTEAGLENLGLADGLADGQLYALAKGLAKYSRPYATSSAGETTRNEMGSLLGIDDLRQLDNSTMWPERERDDRRLTVPIGLGPDKTPVQLDLKESAHGGMGPHGLCIGATGSGKSELLRTLVTALAATHSPEELNFVLVDFKGGATFLGLDSLPHTSAVITNLEDEAVLVDRMFDALSGEMNRRQEVLRKAGNFANVGEYNQARRGGRDDLEPLPALVIIVDEFSELLGQFPDFADLFVAIGRLGRSLHVHLLLASQRLEEGRLRGLDSHLSYRIGLKTFSAMESRQVLGSADAYHLPGQPGAGYVKTDAEELQRFQAAYVSGPLEVPATAGAGPTARLGRSGAGEVEQETAEAQVIEFSCWADIDQPLASEHDPIADRESELKSAGDVEAADGLEPADVAEPTNMDALADAREPAGTTMDAVVNAAVATARTRGQEAHQIWLPPLPKSIELASVAERSACLTVGIGIIDQPYHQRQDLLEIDFSAHGGHVALCGGPQMGKSTALRTMVASLAATHSTAEARFYAIDLGGGQLETLSRLPHVAGVAGRHQPERIRRIVDEVSGLLSDNTQAHSTVKTQQQTFLVVDGWHNIGTSTAEFEDLAEPITQIAADGPSAGIHLLVATPRWNTLRPAIRDLIGTRLELKLAESMDSLCDRKMQDKLPALPGRGLSVDKKYLLIAQSSNQDLAHIAAVSAERGDEPVAALRVLPERIERGELTAAGTLADAEPAGTAAVPGLPVAVGGPRLSTLAWDPSASDHFLCVAARGMGKTTTLRTVMAGISDLGREQARMVVIDHRRAHLGTIDQDMLAAYSHSAPQTEKVLADAVTTLRQRLPSADISPEQLARRDWWDGPEIYLVIDDYDLVADNVLHPLIELIPHARDIGMHLVVARKAGGFNRAAFGPVLSAIRDSQPCVVVLGADKDDGPFFGIKPVPQPSNGPLPGRGIWHDDGSTVGTCQVAVPGTASPASGSGVEAQSASSDVSFATDSEVEP
ncbi:type VII secretion protein EccCa [Corynebacterium pseudodiphtheriticum]|uniref:type VII secretion protein EccCa n=1 Tax=Corynebacterium pseudodiphtheriticum TaxID=37637 RepID=UPI00254DEDEA|nr:type VII secretion protein EccCa [Corynebacterium pseudodiphtheriticum]MDK8486276.1 type VII secretion protein EccCa [Corynebacterium pseudodiphtheriticum]MDK8493577.1 type VII secretion protein EccCa [Corynebacterium pseudodiphtheriticum]MDK8583464.1 type VII secretion protein EccCa [Corynebacterium pseudodiphtheriticum]MDK8838726.1 type VII secretion protein EccCa [Corynebacterium pseudodiphtheriticum]